MTIMQKLFTMNWLLIGLLIITACANNDPILDDEEGNTPEVPVVSILEKSYAIVDTNVSDSYSDTNLISKPSGGQAFYGQDANYIGNQPSYTNNTDSTITDNITGLMWEQNMGEKTTFEEAFIKASNSNLGLKPLFFSNDSSPFCFL